MRRTNLTFGSALLLQMIVAAVAASQPESDYPTYDPMLEQYSHVAATLLAQEVGDVYGSSGWSDSLLIEFDYVHYDADGKELERFHNAWDRLSDGAVLSGTLDDGRSYRVEFSSFTRREGTMFIDSVEIPESQLDAALKYAYDRLATNVRFLLAPVRLREDDVRVQVLSDTIIDKKTSTPLTAIYPDSMSSSARCTFYVNASYKNIERWIIPFEGRETEYIQRMSRRIGPFLVPMRHWKKDFSSFVQLERISITPIDSTTVGRLVFTQPDEETSGSAP